MSNDFVELTEEELKTFFKNLGILIKWYRMKGNFSQEKMQLVLGLNMHNVETGTENLTLTSILRIAKYLKTKPNKLIMYALMDEKIHVFQEGIVKLKILNRSKKKIGSNKK